MSPSRPSEAASAEPAQFDLFAVAAPGLEPLVARELGALGVGELRVEAGGVAWRGGLPEIARANLWLRTASRVLARVGRFHARALGELERRAAHLPWERFLARGRAVQVRVTSRKSRLYHQRAIAERVGRALEAVTGIQPESGAGGDDTEILEDRQLIVVRFLRDECLLSVDTSGALLHRRGYRLATAKAPLRETLAAALLLAAGWDGRRPLLDPFCGSGTIAIEAALLARGLAPGLWRPFAFEQWPGTDATVLEHERAQARRKALEASPAPIYASDHDPGAIRAARANAERAGVAADITFACRGASQLPPLPGPGLLATNPPYGRRVGDWRHLARPYETLGRALRRTFSGWDAAILAPAPRSALVSGALVRESGLAFREVMRTSNGGITVRLLGTMGLGRSVD
jgi:putative N6-adenine-specific DNA methylase